MKKNIVGIILFCFIVGTAVFINKSLGLFTEKPLDTYTCELKSKPKKPEIKAAYGSINKKSPIVRQAVFDLQTKKNNIELVFPDEFQAAEKMYLRLSYFRSSPEGMRFINSESVNLVPESFYYQNNDKTALIVSSYEWLDNLDSYENLYIIAEAGDEYSDFENPVAKFDPNFAKEILRINDKSQFSPYE